MGARRFVACAALAATGAALSAAAMDVTACRGETVNAFLPDGAAVAGARDGFAPKVGAH